VIAARPQTVVDKKDIAVGAVGALLSHPPKSRTRAKFSEASHRWDAFFLTEMTFSMNLSWLNPHRIQSKIDEITELSVWLVEES
jgi:hypothetical protein